MQQSESSHRTWSQKGGRIQTLGLRAYGFGFRLEGCRDLGILGFGDVGV